RVCNHRGHRRRCSGLAPRLDRAVQRRSARDRNREQLFAHRRPQLRVFRARACALLRVTRRRAVVLAAVRGLPAHARRHRRRMAGAALDRLAHMAGCRAPARPGSARAHAGRGDRHRRMVSQSADAAHPVGGLIARASRRAAMFRACARLNLHLKAYEAQQRGAPGERALIHAASRDHRPSPANGNTRPGRRVKMRCKHEGGTSVNQSIINLYDRFTHGSMSRRAFLDRLAELAGSTAAAAALLPLLQNNYAQAAIVAADDARLAAERVSYDSPKGKINGYLVRGKALGKRPTVIVIHENRGLNPHIEDVARRLAVEGYLALAPDLLSVNGGTPPEEDKARELHTKTEREDMIAAALAAIPFMLKHAESTGKVGAVGFCF